MAEKIEPVPYEVVFLYSCQFCKKAHAEYGRLVQPGVVLTHQGELKRRLLELVKEKFLEAHPKKEFDLTRLTVEEFTSGNKTEVDPATIEVKEEDLTKKKEEKKQKEEGLQIEKILPLPMMGTNVAGIEKMLTTRMTEIRKREKEIDEQVKKLTKDLEEMTTELAELEQLQKVAEEIAAKKSEKEKKK